jgi:DNA gyrase subunit B
MTEYLSSEEIIEHIRRRPGMYFGSVGVRGVEQFVYELVSNVLDSYLMNQATFVNVNLDGATISVVDDGSGLPFDEPSDLDDVSLATQFLTHLHWTRSQDEHAPHVHMMALGIGLAPLNFASTQLKVRSWRSGVLWEQQFIRGVAQDSATIVEHGNGRGTRIDVIPDSEIFGQAKPRSDVIRRALFEVAHLFSGITIEFHKERFYVPKGLQTLGFMLLDPLSLRTNSETLPFHAALRYEDIFIEVALFGNKRSPTRTFSWVNGTRTPEHGSHVEGLFDVLKEISWKPALILIHVVMFEPEFAGPMRTKLDVPHIQKMIQNALREPLYQYRRT